MNQSTADAPWRGKIEAMRLPLNQVPTPALVIDHGILEQNLTRLREISARTGVKIRPHLKTAKCAEIAAMATGPHTSGVTVSTLLEAEFFFSHGHRDIFLAVVLAPAKLARAAGLARAGARLSLAVDSVHLAREAARVGKAQDIVFELLIEVDCGEGRSGVSPDSTELLAIAAEIKAHGGASVRGLFTHAGHSYAGRGPGEFARIAQNECDAVRTGARRLAAHGVTCETVSVGSSPTALHGRDFSGITEIRCGVCLFNDLFQAGIGSCARSDLALSVLATVIGCQPARNRFLIDAGALALSKDRSTQALAGDGDAGFGLLMDLDGRLLPGLRVSKVSQEHGSVESSVAIDFERFRIGTLVRVLPNHACLTAACYDRYHVIRGAGVVEAVWERINGW